MQSEIFFVVTQCFVVKKVKIGIQNMDSCINNRVINCNLQLITRLLLHESIIDCQIVQNVLDL